MNNQKPTREEFIDNLANFLDENNATMSKSNLAEILNQNDYEQNRGGSYNPEGRGISRVVGARADFHENNGDLNMRLKINTSFTNNEGNYDFENDENF